MNPLALAPATLPDLMRRLTPRQLEIVGLLATGQSTKQIATLLSIHRNTIIHHVARACEKLDIENKTQLIVMYVMWEVTK